jgi:hypothetical protein
MAQVTCTFTRRQADDGHRLTTELQNLPALQPASDGFEGVWMIAVEDRRTIWSTIRAVGVETCHEMT